MAHSTRGTKTIIVAEQNVIVKQFVAVNYHVVKQHVVAKQHVVTERVFAKATQVMGQSSEKRKAEGTGVEPATGHPATDFESAP